MQAKLDIADGVNLQLYKHHQHPDIRALVARTEYAPLAYIRDPAPEVRLGLIETGKWLNRIAPNETNPRLILSLIERGITHPNFRRLGIAVVNHALDKLE